MKGTESVPKRIFDYKMKRVAQDCADILHVGKSGMEEYARVRSGLTRNRVNDGW